MAVLKASVKILRHLKIKKMRFYFQVAEGYAQFLKTAVPAWNSGALIGIKNG